MGSWHQASVLSACFADLGHEVTGVVDDEATAQALNDGVPPVYEPGLEMLVRQNLRAGRLRYSTSYEHALEATEFCFLSIDTPVGPGDESDLEPIFESANRIFRAARGSLILCVTAQVPVGTCHRLGETANAANPTRKIEITYVPEFLRLGSALDTFRQADRFVIGADDPTVAERVAKLYRPLNRPIVMTRLETAEMSKHASNAFLATSISFINEIADLCEVTGADVTTVAEVMKLDRRIGPHAFLAAGLGYAGGTLGREIRALHHVGERHQMATGLLDAVHEVNDRRIPRLLERIDQICGGLSRKRVAVLGLTYKSGTSTLRRSAALQLIDQLLAAGATASAYDPLARGAELVNPGFEFCTDLRAAISDSDLLVLVAPWPGMSATDIAGCGPTMRRAVILDSGNFISPSELPGFEYHGVGRR